MGDVSFAAAACEAKDGAARIGTPIGRTQSGMGGDDVHAAAIGHLAGQRFDVGGVVDKG